VEDIITPESGIDGPAESPPARVRGIDLLIGVPIIWVMELGLGIVLVLWAGIPFVIEDHPIPLLVLTLASGALTALIAWFFVCRKYGQTFAGGFLLTRPAGKALWIPVATGIGLAIVGSVLSTAYSTGEHMFSRLASTPAGMVSLAILVLLLPFVEELYYRGFIYTALENTLGAPRATAATIIWFGTAHCLQSLSDPIAIPIVFVFGAVLTIQRRVTGSLTASLVSHLTYNASLVLIAVIIGVYAS
jgi:membrane protease YdiL (CAAX protease family)